FRERTASPLYGVFLTSFILWNWNIVFVLFWESTDQVRIPKIEYIQQNLLWGTGWWGFVNAAWIFFPPAVLTYLIIEWLPPLHNWAHRVSTKHYFSRKSVFDEIRLEYEKKESQQLKHLAVIKTEQAASERTIQKNMTDEDRWLIEYQDFARTHLFYKFRDIIRDIYENDGWPKPETPKDAIAFVHASGLTTQSSGRLELTGKVKFFVREYLRKFPL
ncbi:MAG: hypothetical protein HYT27_00340, partial [Parcubacteria group bacterium]|nr:hypothetical protein [Parcubacteria group bacterium]